MAQINSNTVSIDRWTNNCELNIIEKLIRVMIKKTVRTALLAKVTKVTPNGGSGGWVDILPLVGCYDNDGQLVPECVIYNVPYFRYISGTSAVVLDPTVGDIGLIVACEKNIKEVTKDTEQTVKAQDHRTYDYSDAIYIGGLFGKTPPTNFIELNNSAQTINITAPNGLTVNTNKSVVVNATQSVTVTTPTTTFNGNVQVNGNISASGDSTSTGEVSGKGIKLSTHVHPCGDHDTGKPK